MDSIAFSFPELNFPPDVVKPGSTVENPPLEEIDALISMHQASILEHESSLNAIITHYRQLIGHHHREIARYRGCRNMRTALINRLLPVEVFSEILLQYSFIARRSRHRYSWLKAAHVCRYWRNVVRSMPRLFSYIRLPVASPTYLDEFIQASGQVLLDVICATSNGSHLSDSELWGKVLPRTETLYLYVEPPLMCINWPLCPAMSSLTWCCDGHSAESEDSKVWPAGISSIMPNLQSLEVDMTMLGADWLRYPLPPSLTTLKIHHDTHPQGTMADLCRTLTDVASLKNIEFTHLRSNDYRCQTNVPMDRKIAHLKLLSLKGALTPILSFLRHVRAVDNVILVLTHREKPKSLWSLSSMLRTKLAPVQSTVPSVKLHLVISVDPPHAVWTRLELTIWVPSEQDHEIPLNDTIPRLYLELGETSVIEAFQVFETFSNDLASYFIPAKHLVLAFDGEEHQQINLMQNALQQFRNVTHLTMELPGPVYRPYASNFLVEFPSVLAPSDNRNQGPIILPNMHTLQINARFAIIEHDFQTFYVVTLEALRRRRDAYDLRLRTLELVVPSEFIPFIDEHSHCWQDVVDEQMVEITR